ncbi:MAG: hypothetical protein ACSLFR_18965 [Solirubrobacteraceae bacterium]
MASSILVLLGVLLFALDTMHGVTNETRARMDDAIAYVPTAAGTPAAEDPPSRFETIVTDANEILRGPFQSAVPESADAWTRELVPAFLALLVWGVGLSAVAKAVSRPRRQRYVSTRVP